MFSVRAVIIDSYLSKSFPELCEKNNFDGAKHWLEPVIRIFGSTPDGNRAYYLPFIFILTVKVLHLKKKNNNLYCICQFFYSIN